MADENSYEVLILDNEDLAYLHTIAVENAVTVTDLPRRAMEPVATATVALMGAGFAVATVLHLMEKRKGGQVIDLRPTATRLMYRSSDVLYGLVVLIAVDGTVTVEVHEPKGMFGPVNELIIGALGELVGADAAAVSQLLAEQLPPGSVTLDSAAATPDGEA